MVTVIVGAGISGLLLARALQARGESSLVLEKSRGFGGRLAVKRVGEAVFDSGAQFLTARDPAFVALVDDWRKAGLLAAWPGSDSRLIGRPAMNAVPKALAEGLAVLREHKVTAARPDGAGWMLELENRSPLAAHRLVLTCPVPQALALLDAGGATLPGALRNALNLLTYHPCLALLVTLDGPSRVPAEGLSPTFGPLRWIADNRAKGVAPAVPAAVTLHADPEFSAAHYPAPEDEVARKLLPFAEPWLGARVTSATLHRWKFSEPKATHPERSIWLPAVNLGFAGDAFGGPRVEGAALSALDLARRLGA